MTLPWPLALFLAWGEAWRRVGTGGARRKLWRSVAYVTRYGRTSLREALQLDQELLGEYGEALGEIVGEENGPGQREK